VVFAGGHVVGDVRPRLARACGDVAIPELDEIVCRLDLEVPAPFAEWDAHRASGSRISRCAYAPCRMALFSWAERRTLRRYRGRQGARPGLNQRSVDTVANPMRWANGETDPRRAREGTL
jgi:hypothetical protein